MTDGAFRMSTESGTEHDLSEDRPSEILHPVAGVVWAAFWGTPIAAGVVLAINYRRMGKKAAAGTSLLISLAASAALVALIVLVPDDAGIPDPVFYVPQLLAVYYIADALQGPVIKRHLHRGGTVSSVWPSIGVGILLLPVVLSVFVAIAYLTEPDSESGPGIHAAYGNDDIYFSGDATQQDADELARLLRQIGYFGTESGGSVRLELTSGKYVFSFIVVDEGWNNTEFADAYSDLGHMLVESGYPAPLTIHLCDHTFTIRRTINIPAR